MICVTIQGKTLDEIFDILDRPAVEMAEIRLDRCRLSDAEVGELFSGTDTPLVATYRLAGLRDISLAEHKLSIAIDAGAKYVDIEVEAPAPMGKRLSRLAREKGTILIRSYHNYDCTPPAGELRGIVERCRRFGGELVKIAVMAQSSEDVAVVRSLYDENGSDGRLVAFCMGAKGSESRLQCLAWGAPFTYASLASGEETAEGQMPLPDMADALYGDSPVPSLDPVRMPASKSFAQRAIVAAALADGTSHLTGYSPCADSAAAINFAKALGASVKLSGAELTVKGAGSEAGSLSLDKVDVGESGLLARLSIPLLARLSDGPTTVEGSGTLLDRPLGDANDIMAAFGVMLTNLGRSSRKDVFVPLRIGGRLLPGRADVSGKGGSQLISGLLMALPLAEKNSALFVHDPRSIPYMFITMDVLRKFGVRIGSEMEGDDEFIETQDWALCSAINFKIRGGQRYQAADFEIEGDWSSAAAFMVAGAVFGGVTLSGLDTSSLQADLTIMDILVEAGACVSQDEDGLINVRKAPLNAFSVDLNHAPDLFPPVAVLAAFCPGTSRIAGAGRLVGKESNRSDAILDMLAGMGVDAEVNGDEMTVTGMSLSRRLLTGNLLCGGSFSSCRDHRLVMALSVAALGADSPVVIDDVECVAKSYPRFLKDFSKVFCGGQTPGPLFAK